MNEYHPKISIITATYNRNDAIWLAIQSMLNQSYRNWEWFIIDDGSDDDIVQWIPEMLEDNQIDYAEYYQRNSPFLGYNFQDGRVIYYTKLPHIGHPSPVRNFAIKFMMGELVAFRDDDGFWHPDFLFKMSRPFQNPSIKLTYCQRHISHYPRLHQFYQDYLLYDDFAYKVGQIYDPAYIGEGRFKSGADTGDVMLRSDCFLKVGGFDETNLTTGTEDQELWQAIYSQFPDMEVAAIPEPLNFYIWHQSAFPNRTSPRKSQLKT